MIVRNPCTSSGWVGETFSYVQLQLRTPFLRPEGVRLGELPLYLVNLQLFQPRETCKYS